MCTAMTVQTPHGDSYFCRTMDFSYALDPELFLIPKGYDWNNAVHTHKIQNRYCVIGIGQDISPVILADGVNEMGFAAAALYFPGYAHYDTVDSQDSSAPPIAALELVNFLLSQCASVQQAVPLLHHIRIIGHFDPVTNSVAPLHWIIADQTGACRVVEKTAGGLHVMENPIGVLSNSPDFQWHMTNLRNYGNITSSAHREAEWNQVKLVPFGQGAGTIGLPGDYTPPSRFVRTAYQKSHTVFPPDENKTVSACFHVMESVSIPMGVVATNRGTCDYTQYTSLINLSTQKYYFKTYDNSQITAVEIPTPQEHDAQIQSLGKLVRPVLFERWDGCQEI